MGRVPKATISLMYWKVRLESICGSGPGSGGDAGAATGSGARALAFSGGADDVPLLQAILLSMNISRGRRKLNHGGHKGTQEKPVCRPVAVPEVLSGLMVSPWSYVPPWLRTLLLQTFLALRGMHQP